MVLGAGGMRSSRLHVMEGLHDEQTAGLQCGLHADGWFRTGERQMRVDQAGQRKALGRAHTPQDRLDGFKRQAARQLTVVLWRDRPQRDQQRSPPDQACEIDPISALHHRVRARVQRLGCSVCIHDQPLARFAGQNILRCVVALIPHGYISQTMSMASTAQVPILRQARFTI